MDPRLLYIRQRLRRRGGSPAITLDATSGIYSPASATEWSALLSSASISSGNPSHTWTCQESSGNLSDSIGSVTLTAGGSPGYQAAVSGWSRKAVTIAAGSTTDKFAAAAGSGPDVSAESVLWIFYVSLPTSVAGTSHAGAAAAYAGGRSFALSNTDKLISYLRNANANSLQNHVGIGVFPIALQYDRTNSTALTFTTLEKISHTYVDTAADGAKGIGSLTGAAAPAMSVVYMAAFEGAAAEMSEANVKTMLTTLGWSLSY